MKTLLTYLRLAQWYSDAAKGYVFFNENHNHMERYKEYYPNHRDWLYLDKESYIKKACKRAIKLGINPYYDENEGCIYFELPNGQISFHCDEELKKYCIVKKHKWSGLTNSRDIINEHFNKERAF